MELMDGKRCLSTDYECEWCSRNSWSMYFYANTQSWLCNKCYVDANIGIHSQQEATKFKERLLWNKEGYCE